MAERIAEAYQRIADLHQALGLPSVGKMPGKVWDHAIGDEGRFVLYANMETVDHVPPVHAMVHRGGWPVLLLWPDGGMCVGSRGNEDDFIDVLNAEIARAKGERPHG